MPHKTVPSSSMTQSAVSSPVILSSYTKTPSSMMSPSPQPWATATDLSYDSSVFMPSPSLQSVSLQEEMERSFETSSIQSSGSLASSSSRRSLSTFLSLSSVFHSSLSSSLIDSHSETEKVEVSSPVLGSGPPSTEPSLPSTPQPPSAKLSTGATPNGSFILTITTPQGSGATEQSSLCTIPSISVATERDLGRDIDRLTDEIRTYDLARRLETQDIADNVKALSDELHDLVRFLTERRPRPRYPSSSPQHRS
ncbi:hypothetical protein GALMADRAFT_225316 [Galerina marginata CBS 339.88]|uniref:Uncharacterized protein n=1 Tax=Galerina marginata (strain CBS 339.88) TaxID=685588 RepID=A0A067TBA4_GALM3|nr:hypothetical protein GALMADRAFT_225316 [Galerina marginata CBS 339.88]